MHDSQKIRILQMKIKTIYFLIFKLIEMKKLIIFALIAFGISTASNSQNKMWVGGIFAVSVNEVSEFQTNSSTVFMPQFGYNLNDKWAIGGSVGINNHTTKTKTDGVTFKTKANATSIIPFARYSFGELGSVRFFGQGELPINIYDGYNSVGLNARPGLEIPLGEKWGLNMLMPPIFSFVNNDGSTNFYFGINDGYNIQDYILDTAIGIIFKF